MRIKITPKVEASTTAELRVTLRPAVATRSAPALSPLPHEPTSQRKLNRSEVQTERRVAYQVIAEGLAMVGLTPEGCGISVKMNSRFTQRMGDASTGSHSYGQGCPGSLAQCFPTGTIRLSSSPLWRRATPTKRRNTVLHELAHILANCEAGRNVGHGAGWKAMMVRLGEEPKRCHSVNRDGLHRRGSGPQRVVNADAKPYQFSIGEAVTFTARGETVQGLVTGRNRKTLDVRETGAGARSFRVSPVLLARVS